MAMKVKSIVTVIFVGISWNSFAASPYFKETEVRVHGTIHSEQSGDLLGWVAENLGDINGDGAGDFIVSALSYGAGNGKFYVYSGGDMQLLHSQEGANFEQLGRCTASAGDVNADGINDYIVTSTRRAVVYSGKDHKLLHSRTVAGEFFGFDCNFAGDLNHDGYGDLLVGAPFAAYGGNLSGRLYAISGKDFSDLWTFDGNELARLGLGVGSVGGDINDDGIVDVVVSANGAGAKGEAYVLSGADGQLVHTLKPAGQASATGLPTFGRFHIAGGGDVDNDGYFDVFVGDYNARRGQENPNGQNTVTSGAGRAYVFSGKTGAKIHQFSAEHNGDGLGPGRVIPDINNDGYADVYVAAYTYSDEIAFNGKAYLYDGKTGDLLRTMTGTVSSMFLGVDAANIDDVNGDGINDYILTGIDWNLTGDGVIHIVLGH